VDLTEASVERPRPTLAMISSAAFFQTKAFGLSLQFSAQISMASTYQPPATV